MKAVLVVEYDLPDAEDPLLPVYTDLDALKAVRRQQPGAEVRLHLGILEVAEQVLDAFTEGRAT